MVRKIVGSERSRTRSLWWLRIEKNEGNHERSEFQKWSLCVGFIVRFCFLNLYGTPPRKKNFPLEGRPHNPLLPKGRFVGRDALSKTINVRDKKNRFCYLSLTNLFQFPFFSNSNSCSERPEGKNMRRLTYKTRKTNFLRNFLLCEEKCATIRLIL